MKKFDIVWGKGKLRFSDINVPATDVEAAIAAVRAKHGWMVEKIVSVTEYVPPYETNAALFRAQRNHDMGDAVRAYLGVRS